MYSEAASYRAQPKLLSSISATEDLLYLVGTECDNTTTLQLSDMNSVLQMRYGSTVAQKHLHQTLGYVFGNQQSKIPSLSCMQQGIYLF